MTNVLKDRTVRRAALVSSVGLFAAFAFAGAMPAQAAEDPPAIERVGLSISGQVRPQRARVQRVARQQRQQPPAEEQVIVAEPPATGDYEGTTVAAAELQEMRGGFIGPSGLTFRFGFDIATHVNGALTQRLTLPDTEINTNLQSISFNRTRSDGTTTTETITRSNLASAPAEFREVINGGATTVNTTFSSGGIISAIQNSANNQVIQRSATINLEVIGLRNMLGNNNVGRFVNNALAARTVFGR